MTHAPAGLKHLGHQVPHVYEGTSADLLDRVPVPKSVLATDALSQSMFTVTIVGDEFTALCPATGGPDFGEITICYDPVEWLVESKSLKLYLESYRQARIFHEAVVQKICDDLFTLLYPRWIEVVGRFKPRGGWAIQPTAMRRLKEPDYAQQPYPLDHARRGTATQAGSPGFVPQGDGSHLGTVA